MKRWSLRILMCLMLGVVTTVGVAWGLVYLVDTSPSFPISVSTEAKRLWVDLPAGRFNVECQVIRNDRPGTAEFYWRDTRWPGWRNLAHSEEENGYIGDRRAIPDWLYHPESHLRWGTTEARGWPLFALRCRVSDNKKSTRDSHEVLTVVDGIHLGEYASHFSHPPRIFPLRPIFPGSIINTLFYAAMWFTLLFGWRAHLRQVRKWQGYCPTCKYDLRGQHDICPHPQPLSQGERGVSGCPECGWGRRSLDTVQQHRNLCDIIQA